MDTKFVEQMQKKIEKELRNKEIDVVEYWRDEVQKLLRKKTESLSALKQDLHALSTRMENRLQVIKRSAGL
ncbi:MAG: hypothetical protein GY868_21020 [Deltaproteobacteria bacterium]|nr:hypothetical protein [Deltaproteobacteria bacterium]